MRARRIARAAAGLVAVLACNAVLVGIGSQVLWLYACSLLKDRCR